jgi:hypothetical protein
MKLTHIFCLIIFFTHLTAFSQEEIMNKRVTKEMFITKKGPNTNRYSHVFLTLATFIKTAPTQADPKYPGSLQYCLGLRTKYKISEVYALGYEIEYKLSNFEYSKGHDNLPLHESDRILTHSISLGLFQRINFDKRGNYIGKFMDMGAYAEFPFSKSNILIDHADTLLSGQQKLILSHLKYMNSLNYGVTLRFGYNRIVLVAMYRLSDIFKSAYKRVDLPKLNIGIQIGIHK